MTRRLTRAKDIYETYRFMRGPGGPSRWRALRVARWLTAPSMNFDEGENDE